jgi:hypothetical protein
LSTTLAQLAVASQVKPPGAIQRSGKPNCTLWLALLAHGCYNLLFSTRKDKIQSQKNQLNEYFKK